MALGTLFQQSVLPLIVKLLGGGSTQVVGRERGWYGYDEPGSVAISVAAVRISHGVHGEFIASFERIGRRDSSSD